MAALSEWDRSLLESLSPEALRKLWRVAVGDSGMSEEQIIAAVEAMFDGGADADA